MYHTSKFGGTDSWMKLAKYMLWTVEDEWRARELGFF